MGQPRGKLIAAKESAATAALKSEWLTGKTEKTTKNTEKTMEATTKKDEPKEMKQSPEQEATTKILVAAMPDVKAEDLEVGQVVEGIFRQRIGSGQIVSLGKELQGFLPWIEATDKGWKQKYYASGTKKEFRVLAKSAVFDGLPVVLTARSGDLTRPPSMVEDINFANAQDGGGASLQEQDLSEFVGISPDQWLEAEVVNTGTASKWRLPRIVVMLTAPGGSKKVVQGIIRSRVTSDVKEGPVVVGSKLQVRVIGVDLEKSRLTLSMLDPTPAIEMEGQPKEEKKTAENQTKKVKAKKEKKEKTEKTETEAVEKEAGSTTPPPSSMPSLTDVLFR